MQILAKQNASRGELYLYDAIGSSFFEDGTTAKSVAVALADLKGVSGLDIFINSPGGSVFEGVAIYNQITRFVGPKDVHIDGLAASIASVIAMCGDTIHMAENAMMMIHKPWGMAMGDAVELRKTADTMDQVEGALVATYVGRTGQSEKAISDWLQAETWMNAQGMRRPRLRRQDHCRQSDHRLRDDGVGRHAAASRPVPTRAGAPQARAGGIRSPRSACLHGHEGGEAQVVPQVQGRPCTEARPAGSL